MFKDVQKRSMSQSPLLILNQIGRWLHVYYDSSWAPWTNRVPGSSQPHNSPLLWYIFTFKPQKLCGLYPSHFWEIFQKTVRSWLLQLSFQKSQGWHEYQWAHVKVRVTCSRQRNNFFWPSYSSEWGCNKGWNCYEVNRIHRNDNEMGEVLTMKRFTSLGLGVRQASGKSHL